MLKMKKCRKRSGTAVWEPRLVARNMEVRMRKLSVLCLVLAVALPTAALSRGGGMGSHHSSSTGGAFGARATAPGTNSLGTALSSGGAGERIKGPPLGTGNPAVDREDKRVAKIVGSICRGC
jgi:hypothetical protein